MIFTWKAAKRVTNLKKHGFDFADAERVFSGPTITVEDTRDYDGERRFNSTGFSGRRHRDDLPHRKRRRNSHHLHAKGGTP